MLSDAQNLSRRSFARVAASAALAPMVAPLAACAGGSSESGGAPGPTPSVGAAPVAPSAPPERQGQGERDPMAEELMEVLRSKYGDRLTPQQWEEVRTGIQGNLRGAKALRDFRLPMETEPSTVFRAYRGGER